MKSWLELLYLNKQEILIDKFKWVFINIALVFISIFYAIPNIITDKKELTQEYGTLSEVFVETYKHKQHKYFGYRNRKQLVLITSDRIRKTYKLTDQFQGHWQNFLNENAIGKELRVYLQTDNSRTDPLIVELDKKRVYGKSSSLFFSIVIALMTVLLSTYHLYKIIKKK
ncbi:hypothetical protein KIM67_08795 [Flagellimonas sp. 389]|uniref:hypothetical protein n=1 Tax=Flagellimonas sp. 389 TaxID=2835862 RepID=UPI001BD527DF|nr:hypothetical protein [Flagellimonas sp. 389]MBS9462506.1 hypothetical protein [Flagellimonas sp. 389]